LCDSKKANVQFVRLALFACHSTRVNPQQALSEARLETTVAARKYTRHSAAGTVGIEKENGAAGYVIFWFFTASQI